MLIPSNEYGSPPLLPGCLVSRQSGGAERDYIQRALQENNDQDDGGSKVQDPPYD